MNESPSKAGLAGQTEPTAAAATGPNPLAEPVPNSPPDVSPNPSPPKPDDELDGVDLTELERRLRHAIDRAERGTELLEAAIRKRRLRR